MTQNRDGKATAKSMYIWNKYLMKKFKELIDYPDWCVNLIHGFFEQTNCSVYGRILTLTLISRRSNKFAGTRYLKRGINDKGCAANEVETEQILHDRFGVYHLMKVYIHHMYN